MDYQNRIWNLVSKKLAGEISPEEETELEQLLASYPDHGIPMEILIDLWNQKDKEVAEGTEEAWNRVAYRLAKEDDHFNEKIPGSTDHARPATWRKKKKNRRSLFTNKGILANYLKVTRRNFSRNKTFSLINITGLAIGMACAMLILLWVQYQFGYDRFHKKIDRIYQVLSNEKINGEIQTWGSTPQVLQPVLKNNYPQVEEAVRLNWVAAFILSAGDKHLQKQGYLTDPGFFNVFSFPLVKGNPATALAEKHSIVITEELAKNLFGNEEAMGKNIKVDSNAYFTVTGILGKLPSNTEFKFDYLVPWSYMKEVKWYNDRWTNQGTNTFVLLKPGITEQEANRHISNVIQLHDKLSKTELFVHPAKKWRLYSNFENGKQVGGGIEFMRLFIIIAGFILLIACINYMNLSTARSEKRAREVGIRKVAGALKSSLIGQFLSESLLYAGLAGVLAIILARLNLGWFNNLIQEEMTIPYSNPLFWLYTVGFILLTGLLAGSYPAFYLSAFRPINVLKGTFKTAYALVTPRKLLVILQFTFAIVFIISTLVIYRQVKFASRRDTGINMENLAFTYMKGDAGKNFAAIKNEVLESGAAIKVIRTNSPIMYVWSMEDSFEWNGKDTNTRQIFVRFNADEDFLQTTGIKLVAGRDISISKYPTDTMALLLTESAVESMGLKNPVGQQIESRDGTWHVVGVIKDFIPGSPFGPLHPIVVEGAGPWHNTYGAITFKLNEAYPESENLAVIASIFRKYNPDYPFEHFFVDDAQVEKFKGAKHIGTLSALFAGLSVFISCLGLFALSAYMAENRTKEIGVRKVLGASVQNITTLLSKDFLKPVLVAFIIASPLAWWLMNKWLMDFSYRTSISWWIFVITGIVAVLIAILSVSYQAIKAALANPVKSLRSE